MKVNSKWLEHHEHQKVANDKNLDLYLRFFPKGKTVSGVIVSPSQETAICFWRLTDEEYLHYSANPSLLANKAAVVVWRGIIHSRRAMDLLLDAVYNILTVAGHVKI